MAVNVANAPGEDYDSATPDGFDTWIGYWNELRYPEKNKQAGWCRKCGAKTSDLDGGHVELCEKHEGQWYRYKSKGIFITPICPGCNNFNNTDPFSVEESDLISIP